MNFSEEHNEQSTAGTPKISVIVPVYKVEKYLAECIESVLAQTFRDFELILVDDGSPDDCGKICDDYAARDSRIRVFHKPNGGVSSARNLGIENARGEWIAFVDSDDTVGEKYLEHLYGDGPLAGTLVVGGYFLRDENGVQGLRVVFEKKKLPAAIGISFGRLYARGFVASKLYFSETIRSYGLRFDEKISLQEDKLFMLNYCVHAASIFFAPYCDYAYLVRGNSQTSSYPNFSHAWTLSQRLTETAKKISPTITEKATRSALFRMPALRALFCLYRPLARCSRRERIAKIRLVAESLCKEFAEIKPQGLWEYLLFFRCVYAFDCIAGILFSLRHGVLSGVWRRRSNAKLFGKS